MWTRIGCQGHEIDIALARFGQAPTGNHPFIVAEQYDLEQYRWVVGESPCLIVFVAVQGVDRRFP